MNDLNQMHNAFKPNLNNTHASNQLHRNKYNLLHTLFKAFDNLKKYATGRESRSTLLASFSCMLALMLWRSLNITLRFGDLSTVFASRAKIFRLQNW